MICHTKGHPNVSEKICLNIQASKLRNVLNFQITAIIQKIVTFIKV